MINHRWTGWDATVVDLTGIESGVRLENLGVEGLGSSEATDFTRRSPALDGQTLVGSAESPRDVFWPLIISATASQTWQEVQAAFFRTLRRGHYGVWRVTAPDDTYRELTCRFVTDGPASYANDPSFREVEVAGIVLIADDPWWHGPAESQTFQTAEDALPFFAPPGDNHVFNLLSSNTVASATITNPGDVDAWPVWQIAAPATAFSVGVDDAVVSGSVTLTGSEYLIIDSHPARQLIQKHDGGTVTTIPWSSLTSVEFAKVPAGESVDLAVTLNGAGSVTATVDPLYYRAW